jgi:hypothetical protein
MSKRREEIIAHEVELDGTGAPRASPTAGMPTHTGEFLPAPASGVRTNVRQNHDPTANTEAEPHHDEDRKKNRSIASSSRSLCSAKIQAKITEVRQSQL